MADSSSVSYDPATLRKASKFLSYVLRHGPDTIGVTMDRNGWVVIDELIVKARDHRPMTRALIDHIVAANDKKRFALSDDDRRIRANQGHSIVVDLGLTPIEPPPELFHRTAFNNVKPILDEGLLPLGRIDVHLSADRQTAASAGGRTHCAKVLRIDSAAMAADGHEFRCSRNGIWLSGAVPPKYVTTVD